LNQSPAKVTQLQFQQHEEHAQLAFNQA
jgi:hypothetical protein